MTFQHTTVLLQETVDAIAPRAGGVYADVTLGGGGHAEEILRRSAPDGRLIGVDRDPAALAASKARLTEFAQRTTFVHGEMEALPAILAAQGIDAVDGVVADLGVSSPQFDEASRGFAFSADGPLDMRMDPTRGMTAAELVAELDEKELADIIFQFGEERKSRRIANAIKYDVASGSMNTTADLRRSTHRAMGGGVRGKIDPATRTFQALRIAVNRELDQLQALLRDGPDVLRDNGVLAIISFHSLEDRLVKHAFRSDERLSPVWKRPIIAGDVELSQNPRARSAKLRAAVRVTRSAA